MTRLRQLALNRDGFAFDPSTGTSFSLNPSGVAVLEGLMGDRSTEQIARDLRERYQVSLEEAVRDVADFVDSLRAHDLL